MKKVFASFIAIAICLTFGTAFAESLSAKNAVSCGQVVFITEAGGEWKPILQTALHTAAPKDLVITPSLECGLYTGTVVRTKGGVSDTSTAKATVRIRVKVIDADGTVRFALPGNPETGVCYNERMQQLTATLQGIISMCSDVNGDGMIDPNSECTLDYESIGLVQETMSAHSFNFMISNLGSGDHTVVVEARIDSSTDATNGTADAKASIGLGSLTVDEIRLANGISL